MRIGSLFSGIGGFELGLESAIPGAHTVWQCEIDPYARQVLAKHWPGVPCFEDITTLEEVPPVDLICGGFPCQDISSAGKGAGIHGTRSGLFFELMRVVRMARPEWVCLENVATLTSRGMGTVLGELACSGYDAEWRVFGADTVGAPHIRKRIWIIGQAKESRRDMANAGSRRRGQQEKGKMEQSGRTKIVGASDAKMAHADIYGSSAYVGRSDSKRDRAQPTNSIGESCQLAKENGRTTTMAHSYSEWEQQPEGVQPKIGRRFNDSGFASNLAHPKRFGLEGFNHTRAAAATILSGTGDRRWEIEPPVCGVVDGVPHRVDRIRALGNAIVPACAYQVGLRVAELAGGARLA